jgi:hypothetical protein
MPHERTSHVDSQNTDLEWWDTQERGDQGGFADESGQIGPRASCRCQVFCFHRGFLSLKNVIEKNQIFYRSSCLFFLAT